MKKTVTNVIYTKRTRKEIRIKFRRKYKYWPWKCSSKRNQL